VKTKSLIFILSSMLLISNISIASHNDDICNKFVMVYIQNGPGASSETMESHKDSSIQKATYMPLDGPPVTELYRCDFHDGKITFYKIDSVAKK